MKLSDVYIWNIENADYRFTINGISKSRAIKKSGKLLKKEEL